MNALRTLSAHWVAGIGVFLGAFSLGTARAENLAYDKPAPSINPKLTAHSQTMEQRVYKLTDRVYVAFGFDVANSTMVIGEDGIIIIDTLQTVESGKRALAEFRTITDKPVKAIIYTHHTATISAAPKASPPTRTSRRARSQSMRTRTCSARSSAERRTA